MFQVFQHPQKNHSLLQRFKWVIYPWLPSKKKAEDRRETKSSRTACQMLLWEKQIIALATIYWCSIYNKINYLIYSSFLWWKPTALDWPHFRLQLSDHILFNFFLLWETSLPNMSTLHLISYNSPCWGSLNSEKFGKNWLFAHISLVCQAGFCCQQCLIRYP